jgi:NADH-quinone oxidoreductase subunit K
VNNEAAWLFSTFGIGAVLLAVVGFYCLLTTRSLLRALIGMEILSKAVTLLLILAGAATGRTALAQTLVITLIIVEVAVLVVAVSIVLCLFKKDNEVDAASLKTLNG